MAVLIGSLPEGTPRSFYRDLMEATPCPAVLDFRGEGLLGVLDRKPLVVKPNREELAATVGPPLDDDAALCEAMRQLNDLGAQWVVVTDGSRAVWARSSSQLLRFHPPPVDAPVNPIGCGDSLAAGIAWATRDGRPMPEAIALGIAAAGENLRTLLPCRLDRQRVQQRATRVRCDVL